MSSKKKATDLEDVIQEQVEETIDQVALQSTRSSEVQLKFKGENASFTIGRDRFEKGQTKLVSEAMATLALKHTTCFERVD